MRGQPADKSNKAALLRASDENAILRNVLLNLIIESGVNWSQDSVLSDLMLSLEED